MDQVQPRSAVVRTSRSVRIRPHHTGSEPRPALLTQLQRLHTLVPAEPSRAREEAQRLQACAETLGEWQVVAGALLCQAEAAQRSGELTSAVALVRQACDQWALLSPENLTRASLLKANVYDELGDEPTALQHVMDAVMAFAQEVPRTLRVRVLTKTADLLHRLGAAEDSLLWYSRAEALAADDAQMHLMVANNRAYAALRDSRVQDAVNGAQEITALSSRYGYPLNAAVLDTVARIHLLAGDPARAAQIAREAVRAAEQVDFRTAQAGPSYLITLAVAERALGQLHAAQATLELARQACAAEGSARVKNEILKEQAEVRAALGDFRAAYDMLKVFNRAERDLLSRRREAQARIRQTLFETVAARREAAHYREEARRDPLTGLRNRLYVQECLGRLLQDEGGGLSVVLVDLDHFKSVNDQYSHEAGDKVLAAVAGLLEEALPAEDDGSFAARFGGEEFLLVFRTPEPGRAHRVVEQLRLRVQHHDWSRIIPGRGITLSAGISTQRPGDTHESMLARADRQLYAAKTGGRNRISF